MLQRKREPKFGENEFKKLTEFERKLGVEDLANFSNYSIVNAEDIKSFEHDVLTLLLRIEREKGLIKKI